jgi:hypothetical protein
MVNHRLDKDLWKIASFLAGGVCAPRAPRLVAFRAAVKLGLSQWAAARTKEALSPRRERGGRHSVPAVSVHGFVAASNDQPRSRGLVGAAVSVADRVLAAVLTVAI